MNQKQFDDFAKWQLEKFKGQSTISKLAHLKEEIEELIKAIETNDPEKRLEFADCFMLLYGAAANEGMTFEDIGSIHDEKMAINKERTWSEPNADGVCHHIEPKPCEFHPNYSYYRDGIDYCEECLTESRNAD